MEKGSSSSASSSSSGDSVNGLKFGKTIYFEGMASGLAAAPPRSPAKKGRTAVVHGGQPPRCQVEGCLVDLSDSKAYYCRHKVCGMHSKSPTVIVGGLEQRFCQQCSRFHKLSEFDQGKRSCRRRLAGHNERRRKPPAGPLLASHSFGNHNKTGGFVMDFTAYSGRDTSMATQLPWQSNLQHPPDLLQGPTPPTRPGYTNPGGSEECFHGVSESTGALSLLSNMPWASTTQSSTFHGPNVTTISQPSINPTSTIGQFSYPSWGPDMGLAQTSQQYTGDLGLARSNDGQYQELESSRGYDSMNWSL